MTGSDNVLGLVFGDGSGTAAASVTIGGTGPLTVGTDGITAYAGSAAATINAPVILSAGGSTITNNSTTTLTLANVSSGSAPITIAGSGNVLFSGSTGSATNADGSGYLNTSGGIVINSTGQVDFNVSASPVTGTVTVNSGTASFDYGNFSNGPFTNNGTYVVNAGGTLVINAAHSLANYYGAYLTVNGGTVTANYEQYIAALTMTGGTIQTGTTSGELRTDYFGTTPITTLPSPTTATITTNLATENGQSFDFNISQGTTATGVDLNVTGAITNATGGGFIKDGPGTMQMTNNYNTFNGNVTINGGTLITSGRSYYTDSGGLGAVNVAGRTVTVNAGATLMLANNNVFGDGTLDDKYPFTGTMNPNLPTLVINGGTVTEPYVDLAVASTYNVLGNVMLAGGTLTTKMDTVDPSPTNADPSTGGFPGYPANTDDAYYDAYELLGTVTVAGSSPSVISAPLSAVHLGANTTFYVSNTGGPGPDLVVSAPLIDQSGDFYDTNYNTLPGGLTKVGPGTMALNGSSGYFGPTNVSGGTLVFNGTLGPAMESGSSLGSSPVTVYAASVLGGTGTITGTVTVAGTITGGSGATASDSTGTLTTGAQSWTDGSAYVAKVASAGASNDKLVMSDLSISGSVTLTALALNGASAVPTATQLVLAVDTDTSQVGVFANAIASGSLVLSPNSTVSFADGKTPVLTELDNSSGEELILESATLAAAPEPTSLALATLAAIPLVMGRRRRQTA